MDQQKTYDLVPYPRLTHGHTHPDRMAVLATLLGMKPAPVEACRVLELGCGTGDNVIAMAEALPASDFVGIDLNAGQVAMGAALIEAAGLANVRVVQGDIMDLDASIGPFDYVIAHGVYSWVPARVRERLLSLIRDCLSPHGVAFVSFNTYPGWQALRAVRDLMLFHTRDIEAPRERARAALDVVRFMTEAADTAANPFAAYLPLYSQLVGDRGDLTESETEASLLHDEIAEVNDAFYFRDFATASAAHGLQYLADADVRSMSPQGLTPAVAQRLREMASDVVETEQYLDFLRGGAFRRSLLCRDDVALQRRPQVSAAMMSGLHVASSATVEPAGDSDGRPVWRVTGRDETSVLSNNPATKAAFELLASRFPATIPLPELAAASVPAGAEDQVGALALDLLRAFTTSPQLLELHAYAPSLVVEVGTYPRVAAVARSLARDGHSLLTNRRHERVKIDPFTLTFLPYIDGQHSVSDLEAIVAKLDLAVVFGGKRPTRRQLGELVRGSLTWLGRTGMLRG